MLKQIFQLFFLILILASNSFAIDKKKSSIKAKPTPTATVSIKEKEPDSPELTLQKIAYSKDLAKKIKSNWKWKEKNEILKASIEIKLEPNGVISKSEITTSSGNKDFDNAIIESVKKSSPLPAPPKEIYKDFQSVRFTFDSRELSKADKANKKVLENKLLEINKK